MFLRTYAASPRPFRVPVVHPGAMTDPDPVPIGQILDNLGVRAGLDPDDLITAAVVVCAVLVPDSSMPRLVIANSAHISWIEQAGLVRLAERIVTEPPDEPEYEDDE